MIDVEVEDDAWRDLGDVGALVVAAAEAALSHQASHPSSPDAQERRTSRPSAGSDQGVTILLTDDDAIEDLNARFRGKDTATNVLSFPAAETAYPHLGDVALAYGVCTREAAAQDKALAHHVSHLVVHGVLHLLGHDHEADVDAEAMEALERAILSRLGIADPYRRDVVHV